MSDGTRRTSVRGPVAAGIWAAALLAIAGCASTAEVPSGARHPADPAAAAAMPGHDMSSMDHDLSSMDHGAMVPDAPATQDTPGHADDHFHRQPHAAGNHAMTTGEQIAHLPDGHDHAATATPVDRTIEITAVDVDFEPDKIRVQQGETVRFVVTNEGAIDHEFVIGDRAAQVAHAAEMAAMDAGMAHSHVTNSITVKPGETKEITWTIASHDLQFACHIPGHYDAGMWGTIEVVQ